ncbi:hypothetical protein HID58_065138 [Brassica napus]|uniref:Uncharacterized protein n=1 Tax=Brassica napus TaxID=3708 RepID=A0ABQ7ZBX7_BRANA|nr:hypothetical protein HID58_065138 [Brassica napus]
MVISSSDETIDVVVSAMVWFIYPFAFMIITAESHPTRYQEKIQELLFYWYITETLSGRHPWMEIQHLGQNGLALKIQTESEARVAAKELFQNVAKPGSKRGWDNPNHLPISATIHSVCLQARDVSCLVNERHRLYNERYEDHSLPDRCDCRLSSICSSISNARRTGSMVYMFFIFLALHAIKHSQQWSFILDSTMLFLFRHPYSVGEKCINDGVEMVVKKINFSSITFVGLDMKEYQISGGTVRSKWRIDLFRGSSTLEKMQLILSESQVLSLLKMQRLFNYSFED